MFHDESFHGMTVAFSSLGTQLLERVNGKLQERARAIIERRPDLERFFEN
jgi:hypothetical protein